VSPPQITLSPQINRWTTNLVTITARGSKALALSDPEASDKRVSVELKESIPGRVFRLAAVFPPGFQIAPGQQVQLSVKSNSAERPVIIVPVTQAQRRSAASTPLAQPKAISQNLPPLPATGHP
jgi:hypothetical protein